MKNGLPYYKAYPRDFIEGTIGMGFEVIVDNLPGDQPDVYEVIAPEGLLTIPPVIEVDEDGTGRVAIYRADGVGA